MTLFLFFLGREHDDHAFALEERHLLDLSVVFEVVGKSEEKNFALFLEKD